MASAGREIFGDLAGGYPVRKRDTKGHLGGERPKRQAPVVARRTRTDDASKIDQADDLENLVRDKRAGWRASAAKGRRRNRRYQRRLTDALTRVDADEEDV